MAICVAAVLTILLLPDRAPAAQEFRGHCAMAAEYCGGVSEDGSRAVFPFTEPLAEGVERPDVYERTGGTTKPLVEYPADAPKKTYLALQGLSPDARHVFIYTTLPLVPEDVDNYTGDVYDISAGTATLLSTGPLDNQSSFGSAPGPPFQMVFRGASADGLRTFFVAFSPVTPDDTDTCPDVYERFAGQTRLVSTGPTAAASFPVPTCDSANYAGISADDSHVFFTTYDQLVPEDNGGQDIYQRVGDSVALLTTYPDVDANCVDTPGFGDASADGRTVLFSTNMRISPEDSDRTGDVYKREPDGSFVLVSRGSEGPPVGMGCAMFEGDVPVAISADGTIAIFSTTARLSPEDHDSSSDLYSAVDNGGMSLLTTGPTDPNSDEPIQKWEVDVSDDARSVAFETRQALTSNDTDSGVDVYVRRGGETELASTGPAAAGVVNADARLVGISADGQTVAFATNERLTDEDTDHHMDFYVRRAALVAVPGAARASRRQPRRTVLITAESIAPRMTIAGNGRLRGAARALVRLSCPKTESSGPCHGRLKLTAAGKRLGRGSFRIATGHRRWVPIRLKRALRPRHGLSALLHVRGVDRLGNAAGVSSRVRFRPTGR